MPDFSRAVELGNGVPIVGAPQAPPPIIMTGLNVESDLLTENSTGKVLPALTFRFSNPAGSPRPITLLVDEEAMLGFPEALRKVVRDARSRAEQANADRTADVDETDEDDTE